MQGEKKSLYTVGGHILVMPPLKSIWRVLKKLKIEPPYDPVLPFLGT
jgi:hypothetical protein